MFDLYSAGLKAYTTAFTQDALSICRESTGGHGYAAINRLGQMRSDHDIFQTFEGDNTVLLQQVGGGCRTQGGLCFATQSVRQLQMCTRVAWPAANQTLLTHQAYPPGVPVNL